MVVNRLQRHWYILLVIQAILLEAAVALPNILFGGRPHLHPSLAKGQTA
jgi:hypothetical protein